MPAAQAAGEARAGRRFCPGAACGAVAALVALAALLRLLHLGHKSLWLDEAVSVSLARLDWRSFGQVLWRREGNMALYYLLLRPFVHFSQSESSLRMLSVIAGVATVPVIYGLGSRLLGKRVAVLSALLLSVNACHVVYSQEARGYSLVVLFSALSSLLFIAGLEKPALRTWLLYSVAAALAVYSQLFAALVVAAQWLSLAALPRAAIPARKLLLAALALTLLSLPAAVFVLTSNVGQLNWVLKPSLLELYHLAIFLTAEGGKLLGNLLLVLFLFAIGVAGKEAIAAWRRYGRSRQSWRHMFVFTWLLLPIALTLLISIHTPVFFHRFLIICLPAFLLLVAQGLSRLRPLPLMAALFVGLSLATVFTSYWRTREDWRGAAGYLLSQVEPHDALFFFQPWGHIPFDYYHGRLAPERALPAALEAPARGLDRLGTRYERAWLVTYPVSTPDPAARAMQARFDASFPAHQEKNFQGIRISRYDLRSP